MACLPQSEEVAKGRPGPRLQASLAEVGLHFLFSFTFLGFFFFFFCCSFLGKLFFENVKSISLAKNKNIILKIETLELWVWGRTVDYEDTALLCPVWCGVGWFTG